MRSQPLAGRRDALGPPSARLCPAPCSALPGGQRGARNWRAPQPQAAGVPLFNGKDLTGWHNINLRAQARGV